MGLFGHGGKLSKLNKKLNRSKTWKKLGKVAAIGAGVVLTGGALGALAGGATAAAGAGAAATTAGSLGATVYGAGAAATGLSALEIAAGAYTANSIYGNIMNQRYQAKSLSEQRKALLASQDEIAAQRQREEEQQRRENAQLMNSMQGCTNVSFGGVSSPTIGYDKYGDLG